MEMRVPAHASHSLCTYIQHWRGDGEDENWGALWKNSKIKVLQEHAIIAGNVPSPKVLHCLRRKVSRCERETTAPLSERLHYCWRGSQGRVCGGRPLTYGLIIVRRIHGSWIPDIPKRIATTWIAESHKYHPRDSHMAS